MWHHENMSQVFHNIYFRGPLFHNFLSSGSNILTNLFITIFHFGLNFLSPWSKIFSFLSKIIPPLSRILGPLFFMKKSQKRPSWYYIRKRYFAIFLACFITENSHNCNIFIWNWNPRFNEIAGIFLIFFKLICPRCGDAPWASRAPPRRSLGGRIGATGALRAPFARGRPPLRGGRPNCSIWAIAHIDSEKVARVLAPSPGIRGLQPLRPLEGGKVPFPPRLPRGSLTPTKERRWVPKTKRSLVWRDTP